MTTAVKPTRFQVDIKPSHHVLVRELMRRLGGVSAGDAVGFLLETQGATALARLSPDVCVPPTFTTNVRQDTTANHGNGATQRTEPQQTMQLATQYAPSRHPELQVDAMGVLDSLIGGK